MPSPNDLQRVLDQPVCIMLELGLTHRSCVVHVCISCVVFCGLRFSHILMIVLCMHLVHILHLHILNLHPKTVCFMHF